MKLSRLELAVLSLTAFFILFTAGFFLFHRNADGVFTVETQTAPTASVASPSGDASASASAKPAAAVPSAAAAASESRTSAAAQPTPALQKINLNTATEAQLEKLPGIGPSKAADILAYREKNGPFSSVRDIMKVSGIKDGTFTQIKDYITVK